MPSPKWDLHFDFGPVEDDLIYKRIGDPADDQWSVTPAWAVVLCMYMTKNGEMYKIVHKSAHKFPKDQWLDYTTPVIFIDSYPTPPFVLKVALPIIEDKSWSERLAEPEYEEEYTRKGGTIRRLNVGRAAIARWDKRGRPLRFNETLTSYWYIRQGLNSW